MCEVRLRRRFAVRFGAHRKMFQIYAQAVFWERRACFSLALLNMLNRSSIVRWNFGEVRV